jgi:S1/P1 Nuclease
MRKLAVAVVLCGTLPGFGWGPEGHDLVARLAAAHLTTAAAARVAEILGPGTTMASISSWADQVRRDREASGPWHYIDIPIDKPHLDMARDCPNGDCVLVKIEEFKKVVVDPAATAVQRKEALMFLVHFVGDMHQPLHCSDNKDKGGNDVKLDFFGHPSNLHSVWDSGLLGRIGKEDELFAQYSKDLTEKLAKKWGKGTVNEWAEQSHKAGQKVVYGKLPKAPAGGQVKIDAAYERLADPVVKEQIEKAGARLAMVLNTTLR